MIVIDASVWISFLVRQDVNHAATHHWLTRRLSDRAPMVAPVLLLAEVGGAIARRVGDSELGVRAINQLLSVPTLRLVGMEPTVGIEAGHLAATYRVRGADAVYVSVAVQLNVPLVSWDREQLQRASELISTYTPV